MDEGHTYRELYEAFKIHPSNIEAWRKLLAETGSLEPKYRERKSSGKIDMERLQRAVEEKPDAYLRELALEFGCSKQAVFYALKKLKLTYKKKHSPIRKSARRSGWSS